MSVISPEAKREIDKLIALFVEAEKEGYDNKLVPFSQHQGGIEAKGIEFFESLSRKLQRGYNTLQKEFQTQKKSNPSFSEDSSFTLLEKACKAPNITPQRDIELPWPFMDRAYQLANWLMAEKRYEEAECVYLLLRFARPRVFEYCLCEATCQQALGKFEEAVSTYGQGLALQPHNPLIYLQIALCFYEVGEDESCLKAVNYCMECAQEEQHREIRNHAMAVEKAVEVRKARAG